MRPWGGGQASTRIGLNSARIGQTRTDFGEVDRFWSGVGRFRAIATKSGANSDQFRSDPTPCVCVCVSGARLHQFGASSTEFSGVARPCVWSELDQLWGELVRPPSGGLDQCWSDSGASDLERCAAGFETRGYLGVGNCLQVSANVADASAPPEPAPAPDFLPHGAGTQHCARRRRR